MEARKAKREARERAEQDELERRQEVSATPLQAPAPELPSDDPEGVEAGFALPSWLRFSPRVAACPERVAAFQYEAPVARDIRAETEQYNAEILARIRERDRARVQPRPIRRVARWYDDGEHAKAFHAIPLEMKAK